MISGGGITCVTLWIDDGHARNTFKIKKIYNLVQIHFKAIASVCFFFFCFFFFFGQLQDLVES